MIKEKIINSIKNIKEISEKVLTQEKVVTNHDLEMYFCKLEKARMDLYYTVNQNNLWTDFNNEDSLIECIDDNYKATLEGNILKIHIPEKIPPIKKGINYTQKRIIDNISRITKSYERLFYDNFTMVIIKIYDDGKVWDADNRNIKPIHDGLIYGKIIKDDNIYCSCYFVQGYYSDKPHTEVFVIPADEITQIINQKLR